MEPRVNPELTLASFFALTLSGNEYLFVSACVYFFFR